jgi:hypothetical protein
VTLHQERTHATYVEGCFGCKAAQVQILGYDRPRESGHLDQTHQKNWDKELDLYKTARKQGIQPASTKTRDIRKAIEASDKVGKAFDAGTGTFGEKV